MGRENIFSFCVTLTYFCFEGYFNLVFFNKLVNGNMPLIQIYLSKILFFIFLNNNNTTQNITFLQIHATNYFPLS